MVPQDLIKTELTALTRLFSDVPGILVGQHANTNQTTDLNIPGRKSSLVVSRQLGRSGRAGFGPRSPAVRPRPMQTIPGPKWVEYRLLDAAGRQRVIWRRR
jgi:hypothetical protein